MPLRNGEGATPDRVGEWMSLGAQNRGEDVTGVVELTARHVLVGSVGEQWITGTEVGGGHPDRRQRGHVGPAHLGPGGAPGGQHE